MFKIGKVINYYEKIGMAVIELDNFLTVGETVVFVRNDDELFNFKVDSIQFGHAQVESATKGQIISLKVPKKLSYGTYVYKKN